VLFLPCRGSRLVWYLVEVCWRIYIHKEIHVQLLSFATSRTRLERKSSLPPHEWCIAPLKGWPHQIFVTLPNGCHQSNRDRVTMYLWRRFASLALLSPNSPPSVETLFINIKAKIKSTNRSRNDVILCFSMNKAQAGDDCHTRFTSIRIRIRYPNRAYHRYTEKYRDCAISCSFRPMLRCSSLVPK